MQCISIFLEQFNHEFPDVEAIYNERKAYRIDGENGIKKHCQLQGLKSVDYYEDHSRHGFLMVEFSDLIKQNEGLNLKISALRKSDIDKKEKNLLLKTYFNTINRELVDKFKDTQLITSKISVHLKNIPAAFSNTAEFIIVVAPLSNTIDKGKRIEILKFLDTLKDKVSQALPKQLYSRVKIMPLNSFLN